MKIIIEGRVHINESVIQAATGNGAASVEIAELETHRDAENGELFVATMIGHPDEDLECGMVLISCGPIALEVRADELQRALRAFVE